MHISGAQKMHFPGAQIGGIVFLNVKGVSKNNRRKGKPLAAFFVAKKGE